LEMLKAGFRVEEIREAEGQHESAEAEHKMRHEEFNRAEKVYQQGAGSRSDYDLARGLRDAALAQMRKAKARLDLLKAGTRMEEIQQAEAQYQQSKANLDLLLAGTRAEDIAAAKAKVLEAQGKLNEIDANLQEAIVRAPERVIIEVLA